MQLEVRKDSMRLSPRFVLSFGPTISSHSNDNNLLRPSTLGPFHHAQVPTIDHESVSKGP